MKPIIFRFATLATLLSQSIFALPNFDIVVQKLEEDKSSLSLTPVHEGASNTNYILSIDDEKYFVRIAPTNQRKLYADLEVESNVLQQLSSLGICAAPLYFNKEKQILITEYLPHDLVTIDLRDKETRAKVFTRLKEIANSGKKIDKEFAPLKDILKLLLTSMEVKAKDLDSVYFSKLLPALEKIDQILEHNPTKSLCHLDLHSKNILKNDSEFLLIDWEYATMSHPFLVLASMASIERWDDAEMFAALSEYVENPTDEDKEILYQYRIIADLFWAVWNHIQVKLSPTNAPYEVWEKLFEEQALQRIENDQFATICMKHNL